MKQTAENVGVYGKKRKCAGLIFLLITLLLYFIIFLFNADVFFLSLRYFVRIFSKIFYIVIIVFVFIFLTNLFLKPKFIVRHLGKESGTKGWIIVIVSGIISMGSIYIWYPLLKELKEKGMKKGLIATFLYNRAVKIPILPLMVYYFGWLLTLLLALYMVIFSVFLGIIMDRIS